MLGIGWGEMLIIGTLALLLVGPEKMPEMFRALAKIYKSLREMAAEARGALKNELDSMEREMAPIKDALENPADEATPENERPRDEETAAFKAATEALARREAQNGGH